MVPMYKKGGKKKPMKKESWMEESKEVHFGNKPKKFKTGGLYSAAEVSANKKRVAEMNGKQDGAHQTQVEKQTGGAKPAVPPTSKPATGKTGYMVPVPEKKIPTDAEKKASLERFKKSAEQKINSASTSDMLSKLSKKKTGGKSMEPGGGGRFAAMVAGLKKKGKSEDSAKKIAASIGRKKYGKSKFQEMAAKGKKGLGGMSDSTSSNEAGMGMMEAMDRKPKKGSSGSHHTGPNAKRAKGAARRARNGRGGCNRGEVCFD